MIEELNKVENIILKTNGLKISNVTNDTECEEYSGCSFQADNLNFKFRKSKITPKKAGQFVTLWKRNAKNQTEPFDEKDNFDFYIIASVQDGNFGFFMFPKALLMEKQILTTGQTEGKRGFRLYPSWTQTENKQAQKSQQWQTEYFIDLKNGEAENIEKLRLIFVR